MYHEVATRLIAYFICRTGDKKDDFEIFVYGAELLLSSIVNTVLVLAIGLVFGRMPETLLFLIFFCPLRKYSGGFHASSYWSCSLIFCIYFSLLCGFVETIPLGFRLAMASFDALIVWLLAPVEDPNKPIRGKRKEKIIVKTRTTLAVEMALFGAAQFLPVSERWLSFIAISFLTSALLLLLGVLKNRIQNQEA